MGRKLVSLSAGVHVCWAVVRLLLPYHAKEKGNERSKGEAKEKAMHRLAKKKGPSEDQGFTARKMVKASACVLYRWWAHCQQGPPWRGNATGVPPCPRDRLPRHLTLVHSCSFHIFGGN